MSPLKLMLETKMKNSNWFYWLYVSVVGIDSIVAIFCECLQASELPILSGGLND